MILIDVNLLIYAVNEDAPLHRKAKAWLETTLSGSETVWHVLERRSGVSPPDLISDAHLAALAIEHGATLYSCDSDFARFSRLRWR